MNPLQQAIRLEDQGKYAEAQAIYLKLAARGVTEAAFNLGYLQLRTGNVDDAGPLLEQIVQRNPRFTDGIRALAHCRIDTGRVDEGVELFRRAGSDSEALFYSLHTPLPSTECHTDAHLQWGEQFSWVPTPRSTWDGKRPIRVGYVGYGLVGTVQRFLDPVLLNHSERVQSFIYGVPELRTLQDEKLDVVVDLLGHLHRGKIQSIIAARPAPLICSYIGYPHFAGIPGVYRITDSVCDPTETGEQLIRLPGCCWAFQPQGAELSELSELPADRNGYVTFGALNRSCKITGEVAATWGRLLASVPSSRLVVLANGGEANSGVRAFLAAAGVPGDRLTLVPKMDRKRYLEQINQIDLGLDPWPYAGMTTTCDLFWQGVPVVTLAGDNHRGRVGVSLLSAVGLSELAAASASEYVSVATAWASERLGDLRRLRAGLRGRMASLCDGRRVAAALEDAWAEQLGRMA